MPGLDLTALVQYLGYPGLFVVIFLESGIFFGFFLPGASLLFIAGILASASIFSIWILIPLLGLAAVLGDNVGYWFGKKIGSAIYRRPDSRFFKQEHVRIAHDFFEKYGKAAIFLARFVPIVRTFVPILAGVGTMRYSVFLTYNVLGALVWACGVTVLGFLVGRHIPDAEQYLTLIVSVIVLLTCLPILISWWKKWRNQHPGRSKDACPRAIIFDLDNTLGFAFQPIPRKTAEMLSTLLNRIPIAIVSGASLERMEQYVLPELPAGTNLENLHLFPDTGARCYVCKKKSWTRLYNHEFTKDEFERIVAVLHEGIKTTGIGTDEPHWGERILARETQVTFAGIGVDAPSEKKRAWDPDRSKRAKLKAYLDEKLANLSLDIRISSRTAIDITKKGVDKAHAVQWLAKHLGVATKDMLFVGDDLGPGGNDAMVIPTGIQTRQTSGPEETSSIIKELISLCSIQKMTR